MQFVAGSPAITHHDALIVGDLHFGIEFTLEKKGIFTRDISRQLCDDLIKLLAKTKKKKLILLGDIKERITYVDSITHEMIARLRDHAEVLIVKGNHDGGVEKLGVEVHPPEGFVYKGIGFCHGHALPGNELMQQKYLVSAHHHPQIEMVDALGAFHTFPCVVVAPLDTDHAIRSYPEVNPAIKLILLPAFNRMLGSAVNRPNQRLFGPLFKNNLFKYDDATLYNLEGTAISSALRTQIIGERNGK